MSFRDSACAPLDFLLRRAALPLASCEVEKWSFAVLRGGKGSVVAMLNSRDGEQWNRRWEVWSVLPLESKNTCAVDKGR